MEDGAQGGGPMGLSQGGGDRTARVPAEGVGVALKCVGVVGLVTKPWLDVRIPRAALIKFL